MTRNQRKKAYLKVLDLMEAKPIIESLITSFDTIYISQFKEITDILPSSAISVKRWQTATHEDDKNFIALCVALCDEPL